MASSAAFINPRVGVGVFILDSSSSSSTETTESKQNPRFIMGLRHGSTGAGTWALPGGHLEHGESFEECSRREVLEETGLEVHNIRYLTVTNDVMASEGKHYITVFMVCERTENKEPERLEPGKCLAWKWVDWCQFVGWADDAIAVAVAAAAAAADQGNDGNQQQSDRSLDVSHRLFSPMIALRLQRPEVKPLLN